MQRPCVGPPWRFESAVYDPVPCFEVQAAPYVPAEELCDNRGGRSGVDVAKGWNGRVEANVVSDNNAVGRRFVNPVAL